MLQNLILQFGKNRRKSPGTFLTSCYACFMRWTQTRPVRSGVSSRERSVMALLPSRRAEPEGKAQQRGHEQQHGQLRQEEKEALVVRKIHDDVHEQRQPCQQYEKDARAQHAKRRQQEENEHGKIEDAAPHRVQNAGKRQRLYRERTRRIRPRAQSAARWSSGRTGPAAQDRGGRREDRQADEQEDIRLRERHGRRDGVGEIVPGAPQPKAASAPWKAGTARSAALP